MFVSQERDSGEDFFDNYLRFKESDLGFTSPQDNNLWSFIDGFASKYGEVPTYVSVRENFERNNDLQTLDRLEMLEALPPISRGDFVLRLEQKIEDRKKRKVEEILSEAAQISISGIKIKEGREEVFLRGPTDAVKYFVEKTHEIIVPKRSEKLYGNVTEDIQASIKEHELRKNDPHGAQGALFGEQNLDSLGGARRKEMWIHTAFTGGLKSTLALNWMYNQSVFFKNDSMYVSLEMPYAQCRRILHVMHSFHPKFNEVRCELGMQQVTSIPKGLHYKKVRDGLLDEKEEHFYKEYVLKDLANPDNEYGAMEVHEADPNKSRFVVEDIRQKAERVYTEHPIQTLFVDHAGLLHAKRSHSNFSESQNEVLRDLKRLASGFNQGQGIGVVCLFQINRDGYRQALKNEGKYNLTNLAYANEAEKSADIVTAGWVDEDLRKMNRLMVQCLKARDDKPFDDFYLRVEWPCRRLLECAETTLNVQDLEYLGNEIDQIDPDELENML